MFGPSTIGSLSGAGVALLIVMNIPQPKFMKVHSMEYVDGHIIAERTIRRETLADWQVAIAPISVDAPSCQTQPGFDEGHGWSNYERASRKKEPFTVDEWVNDPGCNARLKDGVEYLMHVTWSPRNGERPVTARVRFIK